MGDRASVRGRLIGSGAEEEEETFGDPNCSFGGEGEKERKLESGRVGELNEDWERVSSVVHLGVSGVGVDMSVGCHEI